MEDVVEELREKLKGIIEDLERLSMTEEVSAESARLIDAAIDLLRRVEGIGLVW